MNELPMLYRCPKCGYLIEARAGADPPLHCYGIEPCKDVLPVLVALQEIAPADVMMRLIRATWDAAKAHEKARPAIEPDDVPSWGNAIGVMSRMGVAPAEKPPGTDVLGRRLLPSYVALCRKVLQGTPDEILKDHGVEPGDVGP